MFQLCSDLRKKRVQKSVNSEIGLFVDEDTGINVDYGYVHKEKSSGFCESIFDQVESSSYSGCRFFVATKRLGVAREYCIEVEFKGLVNWMLYEFASLACWLDWTFFSPAHTTEGQDIYRCDSDMRKRRFGMFFKALSDFNFNVIEALLLGEKESDGSMAIKTYIANPLLSRRQGIELKSIAAHVVLPDLRSTCEYL